MDQIKMWSVQIYIKYKECYTEVVYYTCINLYNIHQIKKRENQLSQSMPELSFKNHDNQKQMINSGHSSKFNSNGIPKYLTKQ